MTQANLQEQRSDRRSMARQLAEANIGSLDGEGLRVPADAVGAGADSVTES